MRLIELGRVQYPALSCAHDLGTWIGTRFRVVRERAQRNAPIQLRAVGQETIPPHQIVDVEAFVRALGTDNLALIDRPLATATRTR
jgi:hypothetical protein